MKINQKKRRKKQNRFENENHQYGAKNFGIKYNLNLDSLLNLKIGKDRKKKRRDNKIKHYCEEIKIFQIKTNRFEIREMRKQCLMRTP